MSSQWPTMVLGCGALRITQPPRCFRTECTGSSWGYRFAPLAATRIEIDIPNIQHARWTEMVRYLNRVQAMEEVRLPKVIHN